LQFLIVLRLYFCVFLIWTCLVWCCCAAYMAK